MVNGTSRKDIRSSSMVVDCWWENLALMKILENDSDLRKICKIIEYKKM